MQFSEMDAWRSVSFSWTRDQCVLKMFFTFYQIVVGKLKKIKFKAALCIARALLSSSETSRTLKKLFFLLLYKSVSPFWGSSVMFGLTRPSLHRTRLHRPLSRQYDFCVVVSANLRECFVFPVLTCFLSPVSLWRKSLFWAKNWPAWVILRNLHPTTICRWVGRENPDVHHMEVMLKLLPSHRYLFSLFSLYLLHCGMIRRRGTIFVQVEQFDPRSKTILSNLFIIFLLMCFVWMESCHCVIV